MPVVNLKTVGKLTKEQKKEIAAQFTRTISEVAGKPPEYVYVVIEEYERENWGIKGKLLSENH